MSVPDSPPLDPDPPPRGEPCPPQQVDVSLPRQANGRRRVWLGGLVVAWGVQAIVTQSLLLREAIVLMFGSEFAWGIVLFAWLFGVAVGGFVGGWAAETGFGRRRADLGLVAVLLALSVAACVELWLFRGARAWLGVEPGELLPLPKTALAAMLFVSPASALVGMAFPLACCVARDRHSGEADVGGGARPDVSPRIGIRGLLSLGNVYALESAGSLIGGAAFSFWAVEHLTPIQTALICGALTVAVSGGFLGVTGRGRYGAACLAAAGVAAVGVAALITALLAGDDLNRRLVDRRWRTVAPGYELVAEVESKYQNLALGRRAEQLTLYCGGHVSVSFPDPYTFVPLAHFWLCQHPQPRRVLLLGGGAEGLLAEVLRHPVEHVDYVEPDPRQIALIEPYLAEPDREALADRRVTVHHTDARYYVKTQSDRFDLVIARLPEPTSALHARLYTDEFYRELRRAMTSRSVLCLTAFATPGSLTATSADYLASIRATLRPHFPYVTVGWGDPAHILAASGQGLISTDPEEQTRRYTQRGVESDLFQPAWFEWATDWLDADKLEQRTAQLDAADDLEISTDLRPAIYMQRLALWERMTRRSAGGEGYWIERLRSVRLFDLVAILLAIGGITLLFCYLRQRWPGTSKPGQRNAWASTGTVVLSVGSTGFATMALSIIWLFAFQNLYGYVYQRIGWIIALFMGGLVVGCGVASWRCSRVARGRGSSGHLWRWLIGVDVLLALLALSVPLVLPALGRLQAGPVALMLVEWCVSIMVALTGVLGGAAFPLAGDLQLGSTGRAGAAAGSVVGADHAGACLGALLSGLLLVPVFGTAAAALLLVGIKLGSAVLLLLGWRLSRPG